MMSESQRAMRRQGIGSSDIGALCGFVKWRTPHDVWLDKRGLVEEQEETLAMRLGKITEDAIARLYADDAKLTIETEQQAAARGTLVHPKDEWIVATPDRLVLAPTPDELVECKWVGWKMASLWDDEDPEGVPHAVNAQAQWQLEVTDRSVCRVPVIIDGSRFHVFTVRRNRERFAKMRAIAERFWFDHVLPGIPPRADHTEGAKRMLDRLHPHEGVEMHRASDEAEELYARIVAARASAKKAEIEEELAKNRLRELIGGAAGVLAETWQATWKTERGRVSWKDVAEAVGASADEIEAHRGEDKRVLRIAERKVKRGRVAA